MKAVNTIIKIVAALAAVAGAVYVIATYGDKIVAWAKDMMEKYPCIKFWESCDCCCCEKSEEATEEAPAVSAEESTPVADESDFVG